MIAETWRYIAAPLVGLLVALAVVPFSIRLGYKWGVLDHPGERKVHKSVIPRTGGLAIICGFLAGLLVLGVFDKQTVTLMVSGAFIFLLGLLDDAKGLPPLAKLAGQIAAALILVWGGVQVHFVTNPLSEGVLSLGSLSAPLTVLWIVGITNAINLIDGLDGLSSGVCAISSLVIGILCFLNGLFFAGAVAAVLAASSLGFLKYNFFPAKIFMGDCGAMFLGFMLGALSVMGFSKVATVISIFIPVLILGIPILDTFFAIVRRFLSKKPIFQADKGHLHHRLLEMGLSQRKSALIIYGITLLMGGAAILMSLLTTPLAVVILVSVVTLVSVGAKIIGVFKPSPKQSIGGIAEPGYAIEKRSV